MNQRLPRVALVLLVAAMADAFDPGSLVGVATEIFGAALGLVSNRFFLVTVAFFMAFDP
jgi:hypothetical protein